MIGAARASFPYACRGSRPAERPGRRESRGDQVQGGEEGSMAGLVSPPACGRFARDDREAGFRLARRSLRSVLAFGAANRARSVARGRRAPEGGGGSPPFGRSRGPQAGPSGDRVGAPTTQHRCQQPVRERYQSTPNLYLWMSQPERSFPVTVSTTHALPNLSSDSMSTRRSP